MVYVGCSTGMILVYRFVVDADTVDLQLSEEIKGAPSFSISLSLYLSIYLSLSLSLLFFSFFFCFFFVVFLF